MVYLTVGALSHELATTILDLVVVIVLLIFLLDEICELAFQIHMLAVLTRIVRVFFRFEVLSIACTGSLTLLFDSFYKFLLGFLLIRLVQLLKHGLSELLYRRYVIYNYLGYGGRRQACILYTSYVLLFLQVLDLLR